MSENRGKTYSPVVSATVRIPLVHVMAVAAYKPEDTVRHVLQPWPSSTVPICRFGAVILPVNATLFLCKLGALGFSDERSPSARPELHSTRIFPFSTVRLPRGALSFVALLLRAPPSRSFNMLSGSALSFTVSRVGQVVIKPHSATPRGTLRHGYGAPFPFPVII